ncbi:MAG TPA: hypothetical protein VF655_11935 [Allosphingosinicella sp.]|jgi:hypothetical protein
MKTLAILLTAAAALPLSACSRLDGPKRVVTANQVVPRALPGSLEDRAHKAALAASALNASKAAQTAFLQSGTMLVYVRCNDFFHAAGRHQGISKVSRGLLTPIISLFTGLLALHDFGDNSDTAEDVVKGLALGSTFATASLNVYDEHFLFGADNIDSVRTLTLDALSAHSAAVLKKELVSFDQSVKHLVDNQAICSPPHILALARKAITAGQVVARPGGNGGGDGTEKADPVDTEKSEDTSDPDERVRVDIAQPR